MGQYGQFCPVAESAEIIGDAWAILIVRALLLGSSRFNVLQRGLHRISPTVLNTGLKELEERGVIIKRRLSGQRGHEYRLTAICGGGGARGLGNAMGARLDGGQRSRRLISDVRH